MGSEKVITHTGTIKSIDKQHIKVSIEVMAGCSGCQVKGSCNLSDREEKEVEIECNPALYRPGQLVEVTMKESLGFRALFLGYLLPFVILIATMFIASLVTANEGTIGLLAVGSLVPYYFLLYLFKNQIRKRFSYMVKPLN